jgi:hypothetical protein
LSRLEALDRTFLPRQLGRRRREMERGREKKEKEEGK